MKRKAARQAEREDKQRRRLGRLALKLADEAGDAKLRRLLDLAINADLAPFAVRGSRPLTKADLIEARLLDREVNEELVPSAYRTAKWLTEAQRWASRGDKWRRVWMHLAGREVAIMGTRGRPPAAMWVVACVRSRRGVPAFDAESGVSWEIVADPSGVRVIDPPQTARELFRDDVRRLAGRGWFEVSWGAFGGVTPTRSREIRLPSGGSPAWRVVEQGIERASREARQQVTKLLRARDRPIRARLDKQLSQVVAYLLREGRGDLPSRGWPSATRLYMALDRPIDPLSGDAKDMRNVRRTYDAAQRLIALAKYWPAP